MILLPWTDFNGDQFIRLTPSGICKAAIFCGESGYIGYSAFINGALIAEGVIKDGLVEDVMAIIDAAFVKAGVRLLGEEHRYMTVLT